jgi:DMSO/TMAO reductase YedYZ molybdopterin-dependent catalytic subunit
MSVHTPDPTDATPPRVAAPVTRVPRTPALAGTPSPAAAVIAGVVAAGVALAVGEVAAAITGGAPSPLVAVGAAVIDLAPPGSKELVVALFGTNDKLALQVVVAAAALLFGALIGLAARRSMALASLFVVALVGVAAAAAWGDPVSLTSYVLLSAALQVGAGLLALEWLIGAAVPAGARAVGASPAAAPRDGPIAASAARRGFLVKAGALGLLALIGQGIGRVILDGRAGTAARATEDTRIPQAVDPAPSLAPENAFADLDGLTPIVMPNDEFYRIDTALVVPTVDVADWSLRVHGMVDREVTLTFDELVAMPLVERYVTIACVSNEVGGDLIGNAKWTGVKLTDVLELAGVKSGATQIVPRSIDGWAAGFPTAWVTAPERPRDALIAVKMNDAPLPVQHGFPARLIVPGLYGYVSATKWLTQIELTTLEAFDSYWVPRGWAKEAPVLTQARIDLPKSSATHRSGDVIQVAGVAWAMDRGISKVEIRVDDGDWQPATLAAPIGPQTWVQWRLSWTATPGYHTFTVRATDGTGTPQEERATQPAPDGARGHHRVSVQVD